MERGAKPSCPSINKQMSFIVHFSENQQHSGGLKGKHKNCKWCLIPCAMTQHALPKMTLSAHIITKSERMPVVGRMERTRLSIPVLQRTRVSAGFESCFKNFPLPLPCTTNTLGSTESYQPEGLVEVASKTITGKGWLSIQTLDPSLSDCMAPLRSRNFSILPSFGPWPSAWRRKK